MDKDNILLTIAARGGSKGIKNKNIKQLCGIPLIAHSVLQARKWGKADMIICSTDSENIASVAKEYGAEILFMRPKELSTDFSGKIDVLRHALKTVEEHTRQRYDILIDLDVTAPIRRIEDIDRAINLFKEKRPKSLFSVTTCRKNPYFNMVEVDDNGYAFLVKKPAVPIKRRQDAPRVYDMNASIFVYDRVFLLDLETEIAISDKSIILPMNDFSVFDIDNETDFQFIEFLVQKGIVKL
jgi:CMP-N,N'-diacetyllegionaminic acid synthase